MRTRVLLVEDNPDDADMLRAMLSETISVQFEVTHVEGLAQALHCLQESDFDIILLDLGLPDSQGLDTFLRLNQEAPDLAIIVLSGFDDESMAMKAVQSGAQDYLVKGQGDYLFLRRAMRYAIERKRGEQALRESHRRLEEALTELRHTQEQIIRQERLHALGQMASGIAHDFNNVLQPILGGTELLLQFPHSLDDKEKARSRLQMIYTASQDALQVVNRLREFYRPRQQDEAFLPVNLNEVIEQAVVLTQPRWKGEALARGLSVRLETFLADIPIVAGNAADLRQALTNLIFNSLDAMPEGGTITFRTSLEESYVMLKVSDTGIGMTPEVQQHCLEPFFSTKGQRGTGLGLAGVYGIIQRHEGTIEIESRLGHGTTVVLRLPIQKERKPLPASAKRAGELPPLRILCVEDEPLVRETLTAYLNSDGHSVEEATNGLEGLEKFQTGQFDVVLTDRAMPEMNGFQLIRAIKQESPHTPVILVTGFGAMMEATGENIPEVDWVVSKPVTWAELREAIAQVTAS